MNISLAKDVLVYIICHYVISIFVDGLISKIYIDIYIDFNRPWKWR